jgi:KDO2-lipid IV(A) lauroyltransferase
MVYYIVYGLLYILSLLPLPVLYIVSDIAYCILYYVIGYRKKVVLYNLSIAFPEKSEQERITIAKKFYKNFTDSFIETIKLFSAGNGFIKKHFTGDFSVFDELYESGVPKCQLHSGHFFNWEYANVSIPLHLKYKLLTVYMPISNKIFDRLFKDMRAKTGAILLPATNIRNAILPHRHERSVLALVADQNPGDPHNAFWIPFFSKPAPFVKAPESGARRSNAPVVFCYFTKKARGYYEIHFKLANRTPEHTQVGELTRQYVAYLEQGIRQQPDMYLWSHRRWKWDWKEEYGKILDNSPNP